MLKRLDQKQGCKALKKSQRQKRFTTETLRSQSKTKANFGFKTIKSLLCALRVSSEQSERVVIIEPFASSRLCVKILGLIILEVLTEVF